eukprot:scaffold6725_cov117-Isochrysis_galbana.AAC.6
MWLPSRPRALSRRRRRAPCTMRQHTPDFVAGGDETHLAGGAEGLPVVSESGFFSATIFTALHGGNDMTVTVTRPVEVDEYHLSGRRCPASG